MHGAWLRGWLGACASTSSMGVRDNPGVSASVSDRRSLGWVVPAVLPAVNLALALLLFAVVVLLIGESPARALQLLTIGAFGNAEAIGYTLYYATNFIFTGLAVAVAFHGGLFNIGAEGQAYIGGLGVAAGRPRWSSPRLSSPPPPAALPGRSGPRGFRPSAGATS